jgi:hypothetical protein
MPSACASAEFPRQLKAFCADGGACAHVPPSLYGNAE